MVITISPIGCARGRRGGGNRCTISGATFQPIFCIAYAGIQETCGSSKGLCRQGGGAAHASPDTLWAESCCIDNIHSEIEDFFDLSKKKKSPKNENQNLLNQKNNEEKNVGDKVKDNNNNEAIKSDIISVNTNNEGKQN